MKTINFIPRFLLFILTIACTACARVDTMGQEFVGQPYLNNPLGEGFAPDSDPLIRFDAFDCTTFVETVLADSNIKTLTRIRYKNGNIDFVNRNHIMETDWLPNNSWLLSDVTQTYGKTSVRTVKMDRTNWLKCKYGIDTDTPVQTVNLEYIPYNTITTINTDKPLLVLFVRGKNKKAKDLGTDLAITHMGFLLPNGILRHASRQHKKVQDVDFYKYINRMLENKNNLGIILMEIKK